MVWLPPKEEEAVLSLTCHTNSILTQILSFEFQWAESTLLQFQALSLGHSTAFVAGISQANLPAWALTLRMLQLISSQTASPRALWACHAVFPGHVWLPASLITFWLMQDIQRGENYHQKEKGQTVDISLPLCPSGHATLRFRLEDFKEPTLLSLSFYSWKWSFPLLPADVFLLPVFPHFLTWLKREHFLDCH